MAAYEATINACASPHAPWFVTPADHQWFHNLAVAEALVGTRGRTAKNGSRPAISGARSNVPKPSVPARALSKERKTAAR